MLKKIPFPILLSLGLLFFFSCTKDSIDKRVNLAAIDITPKDDVAAIGQTVQLRAVGTYKDLSSEDITGQVVWNSAPAGLVSITASGLLTANVKGTVTIFAAAGSVAGSVKMTITTVSGLDRERVRMDYINNYIGSELPDCGWTGNVSGCSAGVCSQAAHDKVIQRLDFYRRLVGLPGNITLDTSHNRKCQKAALMFSANGQLSHTPPMAWSCWTQDGYDAAGNSNIALGMHSVYAVEGYIDDYGANNNVVGHRRWLLYPKLRVIGDGSTSNSNAIWVIGQGSNPYPAGMPEFLAYPPKGYIPKNIVYGRWSFSIPTADFGSSTISMKDAGNNNITLTVESSTDNGYGENTIVWTPTIDTAGANDITFHVKVIGVKVGSQTNDYSYDVILFRPDKVSKYAELKRKNPGWQIR